MDDESSDYSLRITHYEFKEVFMTRSELVEKIAEKCPDFTKRQVEIMFDTVIDSIKDALKRGERVEIRGFGNFTVKTRNPRIARNPKTGQSVEVPMKRAVHFKVGKELIELMNADLKEQQTGSPGFSGTESSSEGVQ